MAIARAMRVRAAAWLLPLAVTVAPCPARAQRLALALPAGPLGLAIDALAKQAGVSIVLSDGTLWARRVPAVRGRMSAQAAIRTLARHAGADAERLGETGWRLSPRRAPRAPPPTRSPARAPATGNDVVVFASKRTAPLDTLAGSAEVITLPRLGIDAGSDALVLRSTILSSTYRGAGREKLFVGGIADSSFPSRRQSVTGLYFGDVRLTYGSSDPDLQLYDIASVEVMQGPQGTLYGSGSLGGVIRLNPRMPVRGATQGSAEIGASATRLGAMGGDANAMVNLPLGSDVAVRAVGYLRSDGGYIDRPTLGRDVNRTRIAGGRATVRWWAADDWTVDATGIAQTIRSRDGQYATIGAPPLTDYGTIREPSGSDYRAAHLVVTGQIGDLSLVSATALSTQRGSDRFQRLVTYAFDDVTRRDDMVTHETRLSRAGENGWVAGIAYAGSRGETHYRNTSDEVTIMSNRGRVDEIALFGEGSVRLLSFLSVGAGARAVQAVSRVRQDGPDLPGGIFVEPRRIERWLLPSASLRLRPAKTLTAYVRYQQGRRANVSPQNANSSERDPPQEVVRVVDGGVRWTARRWRANASLQYARWDGGRVDLLESFLFYGTVELGNWSILSANAGVSGPVVAGLRVDAAVTVNHARRLDRSPLDIDPPRLPDVAGVVARAGLNWTATIGDTVMRVDGWARYNGRSSAVFSYLLFGQQGDYVQAGLTIDAERRRDGATLSVDNLLDQRSLRFRLGGGGRFLATETPLRPLTVRAAYRRRF